MPVSKTRDGWRPADGGLVTALRPALENRQGVWVGWDGGAPGVPRRVPGLNMDLRPIELARRDIELYYHGFSNRTLWPLLHDLVEHPLFDRRWWASYQQTNERFASAARSLRVDEGSILWVHDYHLMLLPQMLRTQIPKARVAFFLHTPFPAPELFAKLPWARELLLGMLGADLVSFHIDLYKKNFLRSCELMLDEVKCSANNITLADRIVRISSNPISIDAAGYAQAAVRPEVERELGKLRHQFSGRKVLVGIDRLDYTKGLIQRLRAAERFMETKRSAAREIALVQITVPSRDDVREYRDLKSQVEEEVGRINGRFTEPGFSVPVHYLYRSVSFHRLLAYYRLADVALVTPLKDGMNLIAKEFVVTQAATAGEGALLLSRFAGASEELREAVLCNPFFVEGLADRIDLALTLPKEERKKRLAAMARRIHRHDVFAWVDGILHDLEAN